MIFVTAADRPAVFLMLSEKDIQTMREGRTLFVDERATGGATFTHVILSLHPTNEDALALVQEGGEAHHRRQLARHQPEAGEEECGGCRSIVQVGTLFERRCIVCWAEMAKKGEGRR